jgi:hypothetical protein
MYTSSLFDKGINVLPPFLSERQALHIDSAPPEQIVVSWAYPRTIHANPCF